MSRIRSRSFYQFSIDFQQTNAAGGSIVVDITPATGQILRLVHMVPANSGTNTISAAVLNEDNEEVFFLGGLASAAALELVLPRSGVAALGDHVEGDSKDCEILQGEKLTVYQTAAGLQNDHLYLRGALELIGVRSAPTITKARSTNAADVTQGANGISSTNEYTHILEATDGQ